MSQEQQVSIQITQEQYEKLREVQLDRDLAEAVYEEVVEGYEIAPQNLSTRAVPFRNGKAVFEGEW